MAATNTAQKRLRILGEDEIKDLYERPRFTHEDRIQYFSLSPSEKAALDQLHSIKSRIYFILQSAYFKARHMFFIFNFRDVEADFEYIRKQYFPNFKFNELEITKVTRLKQQRLILELFNYRSCGVKERQKLEAKARQTAKVCAKPVYIFRELMHEHQEQRIVAPGYRFMQDTIGKALIYEQNRATILSNLLIHKEGIGDVQGATLIKQISPVAWQHINFYGRYEFSKQPEAIDIDTIIQELAQLELVG